MKKIFSIISAIISCLVLTFILLTSFIKTNVSIDSGKPAFINVFYLSTTSLKQNGYTESDAEYNDILTELMDVSSLSVLNRVLNKIEINPKVEQIVDNRFVNYNSTLKQKNIVIELIYTQEQDVIVYIDGNPRVISYYAILYVIPCTESIEDIVIYTSSTNSDDKKDTMYAECEPLLLKGNPQNIKELIEKIKENIN